MSEQLVLNTMEKEDLEFIHGLMNDPDIMSFWFEEPYQTKVDLEEKFMRHKDNDHLRYFILKKNGEQLGLVALYSIDPVHRKAEFAIIIDPAHQGFGYSGKATRLAMDYAFHILNLHKLYLIVDETNEKAIHVYEQAGFKTEAVLKEEYFIKGSYHDVVYMSIFQKDYLQGQYNAQKNTGGK
jgi:diamine N-acetyltransferase